MVLRKIVEAFDSKYLTEAKQDRINFENKFGKELTDKFFDLRQKLKAPENNIYYWIKNKSVEELSDFLSSYQSKSEIKRQNKNDGAKLLFNKDGVKIYLITTYEAAQQYGKGTKWCISGNYAGEESKGEHWFNHYIEEKNLDGGYYFVIDPKSPEGKYCVLKTVDGDIHSIWDAPETGHSSISEEAFKKECPIGAEYFGIKDWSDEIYYWDGKSGVPEDAVKVIIKDNVTEIDEGAFGDCNSLKSITIPNSVTKIGDYAFTGCESLQSVIIPNSVTYIGEGAFSWCCSLKSIDIPNSVAKIDRYAFGDCTSLQLINIPNSVTKIGDYVFIGCESLKSITIPNSVTKIGQYVFEGCSNLIIKCHKNSYAEEYAIKYHIDYEIIR